MSFAFMASIAATVDIAPKIVVTNGILFSMAAILICFSVKHWHAAIGTQQRLQGLMLILYFSMTFMWAMGTTNYGTALRHHTVSWWILVISGMPPLIPVLSRIRSGLNEMGAKLLRSSK